VRIDRLTGLDGFMHARLPYGLCPPSGFLRCRGLRKAEARGRPEVRPPARPANPRRSPRRATAARPGMAVPP